MNIHQDWKEPWIDQMGLIVALSGEERFAHLNRFKCAVSHLDLSAQMELNEAIRKRFTPSNGQDGCQSAMQAVRSVTCP